MEFMKLSEVPVVEKASNAYILVEEGGEIKRLHVQDLEAPQVQADLSEEDPTKASYVHGKEDFSGGGGCAGVITYTYNSGLFLDGVPVSPEEVVEAWNAGDIIHLVYDSMRRDIVGINYSSSSGSGIGSVSLRFCGMSSIESVTVYKE